MDFYEAARFQYASARLLLKLAQFRESGTFSSRITTPSNNDIRIEPQREGSFVFDILPLAAIVAPLLIDVPLSAMLSYVIDRIFKPADDEVMKTALENDAKAIDILGKAAEKNADATLEIMKHLETQQELLSKKDDERALLYERLKAESNRRHFLEGQRAAFEKIEPRQEAKLMTMAAPLLKEIGVPLRRSASHAKIERGHTKKDIAIAQIDWQMTKDIDLAIVDKE
jgi:hypothetical protein